MKRLIRFNRYFQGFVLGMLFEFLYRVNGKILDYEHPAFWCAVFYIGLIVIGMFNKYETNK